MNNTTTATRYPLTTIEDSFTADGTDEAIVGHNDPTCPSATGLATTTYMPTRECRFCIGGATDNPAAWQTRIGTAPTDVEISAEVRVDRPQGNGEGHGHISYDASEKQIAFIARLAAERGQDVDTTKLTKKAASRLIDTLLATKALAPAATPTAAPALRPNRYAGKCGTCRTEVAEGAGHIVKVDGRWVTYHTTCPEIAPAAPEAPLADVPAGHYAIASQGENDLLFVRVDRTDHGTFVKMIVGGHADMNMRRAQVPGVLARIEAAGIAESALLFSQELDHCHRCNRTLTNDESRKLGIGPECRKLV